MSAEESTPKAPDPMILTADDVEPGRVIRVAEGRGYITHKGRRVGPSGQPSLVMLRYVANDISYSVSHLAEDEIEVLL